MPEKPLPLVLPIAMVAAFLAAMIAVKMIVAPWIVTSYGWLGVAVTILACLAIGRWIED